MEKDLFIPNEIKDIVTSLIVSNNILDITENAGVSTIETGTVAIFDNLSIVMLLLDGMVVEMDNINYVVSNVVNTPGIKSFEVTATGLTATEWNVAANFQTGSRIEVNQILDQFSSNLDRFPLIWLLPPTDEDYNQEDIDFSVSVNIVFAHKANKIDRTEKRIANNLKPIIQPLMSLFNLWLQSSDFNYMLEFYGHQKPIEYTKSNWAFYGTSDKEEQVLTSVSVDAIEVNYQLKFKKQYTDC